LTTKQKYPHNLIMEVLTEMGIIGGIWLLLLLLQIFKTALSLSKPVLIFFAVSILFAMISKNIASQRFLWIGLALVGEKKN